MNVALIQSDAVDQGRALRMARVLRRRGHTVTFIVPQTTLRPSRPAHALDWQAEGFAWIPVSAGDMPPDQPHYPRDPALHATRALASVVLSFDAAWFFEPAWAMQTVRERRFLPRALPVIALDIPDQLEPIPKSLADINRAFAAEYSETWADTVYAPGGHNSETVLEERVAAAETLLAQRQAEPARVPGKATTSPAATVCMPYFEEPEFLPEALLSLERQTSQDFTVVVVDDGSSSESARAVFEACRQRYADRGWKFIRHRNSSPGGAKNRAVQEAETEFLIFLDADDLAMPDMVERFLHAILLTGDDVLVARNYAFRDDPNGPCTMLYDPPGNSLIASMGDDMHGGSCVIYRREAFHRAGGFTEMRGLSFDDYELHIRANLTGLRWDVLPEFVYRYRAPRVEGVSRSSAAYPNLARVTRWYRERLTPYGLGQLPLAFASTYWTNERQSYVANGLAGTLKSRRARHAPRGREVKLLLLACNFPFELSSGWHNRVQQMIRYFGSRYQLTLMNAMSRDLLAPVRKQTFQHLHAVLGVDGSSHSAIADTTIPFRVREHYTDVYRAALRALPTDQYHAVFLDQIFMAEFRKDIDTIPVLTEHNIESRLLRQASERVWESELPLHYQNAMREADLLAQYEDRTWPDFPLRATVSDLDRVEMQRRAPAGKVVVAPNGADISSWIEHARFDTCTVLFTGHLAYLPNVDAVEFLLAEVWPKVRQRMPNARLILAGRAPSPVVLAAIERAGTHMGIQLIANPDSMQAVAKRASITVAPLRLGSGTRIKILESMAWGLPIITTSAGVEGIDAVDEEQLLIRDDADGLAEAIVRLLSDAALWKKLRSAGGELVRARYSWDKVFEPLDNALLELIS